jgi:uncharacterized membrane protein
MTRNPLCSLLLLSLALAACDEGGSPPDPVEPLSTESPATPAPAPSPSASAAQAETDYVANGNEPFWSITTRSDRIIYSSPEKLDGEELAAAVSQANGWTRFEARMDGTPLLLEVRKQQCFDDMSGFAFSHEARLTRSDGTWRGCARLVSEPQPRE